MFKKLAYFLISTVTLTVGFFVGMSLVVAILTPLVWSASWIFTTLFVIPQITWLNAMLVSTLIAIVKIIKA